MLSSIHRPPQVFDTYRSMITEPISPKERYLQLKEEKPDKSGFSNTQR